MKVYLKDIAEFSALSLFGAMVMVWICVLGAGG